MNLLNLKYFLTIVEEGSISMASRKLYVSQQALSEHLKRWKLIFRWFYFIGKILLF